MLAKLFSLSIIPSLALAGTINLIHEFPTGTWTDSVFYRSNGTVLTGLGNTNFPVASTIKPGLYQVTSSYANLVYDISQDGVNAAFGIAELTPNVYAFSIGNFTYTSFTGQKDSWSVVVINMTNYNPSTNTGQKVIKKIKVPGAGTLNSVRTLNSTSVLSTDSSLGVIWRIDTDTGNSKQVLSDTTMAPNFSLPTFSKFGVDGCRIRNGYFYYTTPFYGLTGFYGRVKINADGTAAGPYEQITIGRIDDFDFDQSGDAFGAFPFGAVLEVFPNGITTINSGPYNGGTAVQFSSDFSSYYVSTNGLFVTGASIYQYTF